MKVHELPADKLKIREVVQIDIANDPVSAADYKQDEDPTKFKSQKTERGPLQGPDWRDRVNPVMTCYKLVTVEFKWFGLQVKILLPFILYYFNLLNVIFLLLLQTRVESFIQKCERRLFTNFHR